MKKPPIPRRGEVWLARLDKQRPVIILTRDPLGRYLHSVIVAPVTSTVRSLSTEVNVGPDDGIPRSSVANLDNAQLLQRARLVRRVGRVSGDTLDRICDALSVATGCDTP